MKQLKLLIFGLFACLLVHAQSVLPLHRGPAQVLENDARIMGNLNLGIPKVLDTTSGLKGGLDSLGLLIQIYSTGDIYNRDTTAGGHKWTLVSLAKHFNNGLTFNNSVNEAQLGGTIIQNTSLAINSPYFLSMNSAAGDSLNIFQDSTIDISQKGFYIGKKSIMPYYANAWGANNSGSYGDYNLTVGGGKASMEFLTDSNYGVPLNNLTFRNAKSIFPKLNPAEYGPNAVAVIQVGSAFIGGTKPVSTILLALGDTTNAGNAVAGEAESPGIDYEGNRLLFTWDAGNALYFGTQPEFLGFSAPMQYLPDSSFFAGDLWNHSWYMFNMQNTAYNPSSNYPIIYNPTTGKMYRSSGPLDTAQSGTYTPSVTAVTNATGATLTKAYYTQTGSIVNVWVEGSFSATTGSGTSSISITYPVATTAYTYGTATGSFYATTVSPVTVTARTSSAITLTGPVTASGSTNFNIQFAYSIN